MFDESIQVMKFAAIASKVTVEVIKTPETVKPNRRQTRFSMLVGAGKKPSAFGGRGSIEWENPKARSTMLPPAQENTINESVFDETLEETVVDVTKYDKLLKLIDDLREELVQEKKEKVTLEKEIRSELCEEFNEMMVEIENRWEQRLKDEKERSEELADFRLQTFQEAFSSKIKNRNLDETARFQQDEMEIAMEEKTTEIKHLQEKINAISETHFSAKEESQRLQIECKKLTSELQSSRQISQDLEKELGKKNEELQKQESLAKQLASDKSDSASSVIKDLEGKLKDFQTQLLKLENDKKGLKELLDEASDDFLENGKEFEVERQKKMSLEKELVQAALTIKDLQSQIVESKLLLEDVNNRLEEKEKDISDLEEKLEEVSSDLMDSKQQNVSHAQEKSNLIAQISELKKVNMDEATKNNEVGKLKQEMEEKDKEISANEKEIKSLQGEVKSLIQVRLLHFNNYIIPSALVAIY